MKAKMQAISGLAVLFVIALLTFYTALRDPVIERPVQAQQVPTPAPSPDFDQAAALAGLREQIKGREKEPAGVIFKDIRNLKDVPAGRFLAIMEFGYSRSLGVNCAHCHTPDNWAAETKPAKQIARDMHLMVGKINLELLANVKGLGNRNAIINCTTCHRGALKPALDLAMPKETAPNN